MTSRRGLVRSRRHLVAFLAALGCALGVCGWQALTIAAFRLPSPTLRAGLGQAVEVKGVAYQLEKFTVAEQLPARKPGAEEVPALEGSVLVLVVFSERVVDERKDLQQHFCDLRLHAPDNRRWQPDSDIGYQVGAPEAVTCRGPSEHPLAYNKPLRVGAVFMIPEEAAAQVTFRVRLSTDRELIEFRR